MSSPPDHGPLTPNPPGRRPDHVPDPSSGGEDDSAFALPGPDDMEGFGLSDPGRLSGVNLSAGSGGSGSEADWLPPLPGDDPAGSNAEFDLPPLGDGGESSLFGEGPPAAALHVEPAFESEEVPFAEVLPVLEPESPEELAAEAGSSDGGSDLDLLGPVEPGAGWFDSHSDPSRGEEADLGGELPLADDSSNILGRLAAPRGRPGDSSAVRLEAPGTDGTLADEPPRAERAERAERAKDPTDLEAEPLPAGFDSAAVAGPTAPELDLGSGGRADDILAAAGEQPYLPGGTSSIFTGLPAAGSTGAADADADADVADAVEFSDHPETRPAADS
ncbi:MAG: hypothetical protein K2X82_12920, partial [Gemmataceae bacterium]|nr:hypothetical protein [Gemmataceae bacterium]